MIKLVTCIIYIAIFQLLGLYITARLCKNALTINFAVFLVCLHKSIVILFSDVNWVNSWLWNMSANMSDRIVLYNSHSRRKCFSSSTVFIVQNLHSLDSAGSPTYLPVSTLSGKIPHLNWLSNDRSYFVKFNFRWFSQTNSVLNIR